MIIALPLIVFIVFNVALRYIVYENTRDDLESAFEMVQLLVKDELSSNTETRREDSQETLKNSLTALNRAIRITNRTQDTEIFFISSNNQYIVPRDTSDSKIDINLIDSIIEQKDSIDFNKTFEQTYKGQEYMVNVSTIKTTLTRFNQNMLIVVSPIKSSNTLIVQLNIMLGIIIIIAIIISSVIAKKISKDIAKPIIQASIYAQTISSGQYTTLTTPPNSKEIETLYDSLNDMSKILKQSNEAQISYFQNLSHDLRTPLMSIQGYAEGIKSGIFEDSTTAAEVIRTESIRLKNLVDQLLTLSKLENSHGKQNIEQFIVKEVIDEIVTRHQGFSQSQKKTITINSPDNLILNMDISIFDKVISNVLSNAIKYADHVVVINVLEINKNIQVTIQDDGPGISKADAELIFDRFHKGEGGNFGLGLAIVATAMDLIGGSVQWENHNNGAMFILQFNLNHSR